jgi:flagellar basal-body rod modification protein FlgD
MAVAATSATTPPAATTGSSGSNTTDALNKLSGDFNNFLTLLTTQLKNQDPLSPMDSTQFTAQLVAFTGVEQQINGNAKLDQLIALDKTNQMTSAAGFIGDQVEAASSQVWLGTDGKASQIGYTLPADAATAAMAIFDSNGTVIRSGVVPGIKGHNAVEWDGTNNAGAKVASGVYNFSIQALGQDQQPISNITTSIIGTVTNVTSDATKGTQLSIGNVVVPLSGVTSIKKPS